MKKSRPFYIPENRWIEDLPSYIFQTAHRYLPLQSFGFYETYRNENALILNSEWCRVRFYAKWERHPYNNLGGEYELSISYGRLHAPDQSSEMQWEGEACECWIEWWHYISEYIKLAFPQRSRADRGEIILEFRKKIAEFTNGIDWRLAVEAEIWKHYTPELFYLLDLRRPELWEQYRAWLKARYIAEGRKEEEDEKKGLIPYYRVC